MDAIRINDVEKRTVCPNCSNPVKILQVLSLSEYNSSNGNSGTHILSESIRITSVDHNVADHIEGHIVLCQHCHKLFFIYDIVDRRTCRECKHCNNSHCDWFNTSLSYTSRENSIERMHCEHIDEELKELPEHAICILCEHCRVSCIRSDNDELERYDCHSDRKDQCFWNMNDLYDRTKACHDFKLSFQKYRTYRKKYDNQGLLFDDSIHIEKFDKLLGEENKPLYCEMYLIIPDDGFIPIKVEITWNSLEFGHDISYSLWNEVFYEEAITATDDVLTADQCADMLRQELRSTSATEGSRNTIIAGALHKFAKTKGYPDFTDFIAEVVVSQCFDSTMKPKGT